MDKVKESIIGAVMELLDSGRNADEITVREITAQLQVSVSTINYHFGSKDKLMKVVIKRYIDRIISRVPEVLASLGALSPRDKLAHMVKLTADYLCMASVPSRISILADLCGDDGGNTAATIAAYEPMLKEMVPLDKVDLYGMISAFTLQGLFLRTAYLKAAGIVDFDDKEQRDRLIDELFTVLFPK